MNKVLSIVVTFNPSIERLGKLVSSLNQQKTDIFIVDNYSKNAHEINFNACFELHRLDKNYGIAYAQNIGIQKAIKNKYEYIILFDQDSNVEDNFVDLMLSSYKELNSQKVACISPRFYNDEYDFYYNALRINKYGFRERVSLQNIEEPISVSLVISSGSFIIVEALKVIGPMKDKFFIDAVDTEWCFRALDRGFKIFISNKVVMRHTIGDKVLNFFGKKIALHSPFRRYYIIRNNFYLLKLDYIPKIFAYRDIVFSLIVQLIIIITINSQRKENFFALIRAIRDGVYYEKRS
ncbi:glycosyltransferase family 2 protein [Acinetobacter nosocomialis]|uniref:glycosyltransferase family 2 protein n=1 Tax=Acinetobacter TaxID=469 RepID=UPI0022EA2C95|nr:MULTISPECIES: glycosyltransferase family 2 protein [Acinetobacter]MDA3462105.1 glycosyltransferase family 2 protein [Acinetobacter sp. AOR41_HL]MDR9577223.1 glycosyltransferase family 2 protein [Acinetobacter nosocomialis]